MIGEDIILKLKDIVSGITRVKDMYVDEDGLVLSYATIFAHSVEEYDELIEASLEVGEKVSEHNGGIFKLNEELKFDNGILKHFRIREADSERPQIGCGDFVVKDYEAFKKKYLEREHFVLFDRPNIEFVGLHDLDQDYLVYFMERSFEVK